MQQTKSNLTREMIIHGFKVRNVQHENINKNNILTKLSSE